MGNPMPSSPKEPKRYNSFLKYSSLGIQLLATIAVSGFFGYWLDKKFEMSSPVFLLLFIFTGFTGSMIKLYKDINKE